RQTVINERLVQGALAGKRVARLKGGDPFLFGRGTEEAEELSRAGVPFEVVPGVPSPLAAGAYAGISLTHRELSSSVALVTATESVEKDRSSHDWAHLATGTETIVFFMGMRKLATLMTLLMEHGRSPDTPACVVQWASRPQQRVVVGTVRTIAARAKEAGIGLPALTVVGEVVRLRNMLRWYDSRPLFGKRILVTRPRHQAGSLAERIRDASAEPVIVPTIRIEPPEEPERLARAVREIGEYDWLLFTSRNGVDAFFEELSRQGGDARRLGGVRICAIGPKTAEALQPYGLRADSMPDEYRGEAAAETLLAAAGAAAKGQRVLLARAAIAREVLPERLREAGMQVEVVPAYRTLPPDEAAIAELRALFESGSIDVLTFTSSSTVTNLLDALGEDALRLLEGCFVASIGPITSATARRRGLSVDLEASEYTTAGLMEALEAHFEAQK
ncbi:MAG: uroporphyrinogen-III C-methyltransferase, partial [Myxococcales bacterium]|nr:uroporphyrinogen-III C-methyltransferase [Myxococcales bacterium]